MAEIRVITMTKEEYEKVLEKYDVPKDRCNDYPMTEGAEVFFYGFLSAESSGLGTQYYAILTDGVHFDGHDGNLYKLPESYAPDEVVGLLPKQEREIYDAVHCQCINEDIRSLIEDEFENLTDYADDIAAGIANRVAYDGEWDANLSHWDNLRNQIREYPVPKNAGYVVYNIDWDINEQYDDEYELIGLDDLNLPETVVIPNTITKSDSEDEIEELIGYYLTDTYGFCVYSCDIADFSDIKIKEFNCEEDLSKYTDSMLFDSVGGPTDGETIAHGKFSCNDMTFNIDLEVRGYVNVSYQGNTYKIPSEFPEELKAWVKKYPGTWDIESNVVPGNNTYISENNWFEYITDEYSGMYYDSDLSKATKDDILLDMLQIAHAYFKEAE